MNDFSELEAELKQLRPATPSPALMKRVERALDEPASSVATAGVLPRRKMRVNWLAWAGMGLAGAAAVLFLFARLNLHRATPNPQSRVAQTTPAPTAAAPEQPRTFVSDGVSRVVYHTRNEGLVFPESADRPVRRVRSVSHETLAFKDPKSGASIRVSYPTEDIRLIPVSGQ